jgi:AcrR family transcriptional regulator
METTRQRDADRSRAAILDAAEALFAEHGFDAVTMAQVGAAAGVSRGTPGYFFGTKEALYRVVVERAAATLRILAETLRKRGTAGGQDRDTRLGEAVDAVLTLLTSRPALVKLIDRENGLVAGEPHAEALREALDGLGDDRDRTTLAVLAMCWFPVSHPGAARLLGVDPTAPGFAEVWRGEVLAAVGAERAASPSSPAAPPAASNDPRIEAAASAAGTDLPEEEGVAPKPDDAGGKKKKKKKKKKG